MLLGVWGRVYWQHVTEVTEVPGYSLFIANGGGNLPQTFEKKIQQCISHIIVLLQNSLK